MLAELEELGMQLARATAARALAALAAPETPGEQEASLPTEPQAPEAPSEAPLAATPRRVTARTHATRSTEGKPSDEVTSFIRLAKAVCELIALESGLAAGPATAKSDGLLSPTLRADRRRPFLKDAILLVTQRQSDRAALRRAMLARVDEILEADPDGDEIPRRIFFPLCEEFHLEPDTSKLSDEIIGMGLDWGEEPKLAPDDPWLVPAPHPKATDPP